MSHIGAKLKEIRLLITSDRWRKDNNIEGEASIDTIYDKDPVYVMAARMCRIMAQHTQKLVKDLKENCAIPISVNEIPLCMFGESITQIRVFPNIMVKLEDVPDLGNVSAFTHIKVLKLFWDAYRADMDNPGRAKAWQHPTNRLWKKFKKDEVLSTSRFLIKYIMPSAGGTVDRWATVIENYRKPIEIVWAKEPEDWLKMYKNGPDSCMKPKGQTWHFLSDMGLHPCTLFTYHPHIKGAYIKHKGTVAARVLCFEYEEGKWGYGRIYASTPQYQDKILACLKEHKITKCLWKRRDEYDTWHTRPCEFDVPAVKHGNNWVLPVPYFDNHHDLQVTWDDAKKIFHVVYDGKQNTGNVNGGESGFRYHTEFITRECFNCNKKLSKSLVIEAADGNAFCGDRCWAAKGYVTARDNRGASRIVPKENVVEDALNHGYFYTTLDAAIQNGCRMYREDMFVEEEELMITSGGYSALDKTGSPINVAPTSAVDKILHSTSSSALINMLSNIPHRVTKTKVVILAENHKPDAHVDWDIFKDAIKDFEYQTKQEQMEFDELSDSAFKSSNGLTKIAKVSKSSGWINVTYAEDDMPF